MHGFVRGQCSSTWMDFKRDRFGSAERNRTRLVKVRRGRRTFTRPDFAYVLRYRYPDDRYRDREQTQRARILSPRGYYSSGVPSRLSQLVKLNKWRDATMDGWNAMADLIACVCIYIYTWPQVKRFQTLSRLKCLKFPIHRGFIFGVRFSNYLLLLSEPTFTVWVLSLSRALTQTSLSLSLSRFLIRKGSGYVKRKDVALVGILLEIPRGSYLSDLSDAFSSSYHLFIFLWDGKLW